MTSGSASTSTPMTRAIQIPGQSASSAYGNNNNNNSNRHGSRFQHVLDHDHPTGTHMSPSISEQGSSWSSSSPMSAPSDNNNISYRVEPSSSTHPSTSRTLDMDKTPSSAKGKDKAQPSTSPPPTSLGRMIIQPSSSPLSPSMLSASSYKSINLNSHSDSPDEPPRLITYTKHSQGFTWNDELFIPSYMIGRYGGRGRRRQYDTDFGDEESCPVAEIFVTDEEAEAMMP